MSRFLSLAICLCFSIGLFAQSSERPPRLLVRGDDMGVAKSVNDACVAAYRNGLVRSVEVIAPGPWFLHAVKLLKENPELDVGVHLCLTSEWEDVKWGPITRAPSLADGNGYFFPMTSQRNDFPPNTGFLQAQYKLEEVEAELRAQIELVKRHLPRVSHLSAHMGTATASPELLALTLRLADEYGTPIRFEKLDRASGWRGDEAAPEKRTDEMTAMLSRLEKGKAYIFVTHPGLDTPEMKGMFHTGYENVAEDRAAVTAVLTSEAVKRAVQEQGVELISYRDLLKK